MYLMARFIACVAGLCIRPLLPLTRRSNRAASRLLAGGEADALHTSLAKADPNPCAAISRPWNGCYHGSLLINKGRPC
jgi:hypothetical protein